MEFRTWEEGATIFFHRVPNARDVVCGKAHGRDRLPESSIASARFLHEWGHASVRAARHTDTPLKMHVLRGSALARDQAFELKPPRNRGPRRRTTRAIRPCAKNLRGSHDLDGDRREDACTQSAVRQRARARRLFIRNERRWSTDVHPSCHHAETSGHKKPRISAGFSVCRLAERTGLEPATSGVTGQHSNQLNYRSAL